MISSLWLTNQGCSTSYQFMCIKAWQKKKTDTTLQTHFEGFQGTGVFSVPFHMRRAHVSLLNLINFSNEPSIFEFDTSFWFLINNAIQNSKLTFSNITFISTQQIALLPFSIQFHAATFWSLLTSWSVYVCACEAGGIGHASWVFVFLERWQFSLMLCVIKMLFSHFKGVTAVEKMGNQMGSKSD